MVFQPHRSGRPIVRKIGRHPDIPIWSVHFQAEKRLDHSRHIQPCRSREISRNRFGRNFGPRSPVVVVHYPAGQRMQRIGHPVAQPGGRVSPRAPRLLSGSGLHSPGPDRMIRKIIGTINRSGAVGQPVGQVSERRIGIQQVGYPENSRIGQRMVLSVEPGIALQIVEIDEPPEIGTPQFRAQP